MGQEEEISESKIYVAFTNFLGYVSCWKVNEEQAETVRLIYKLFLDGETTTSIAQKLTEKGKKTAKGGVKWKPSPVMNEISEATEKAAMIQTFMEKVGEKQMPIRAFDLKLWKELVDRMVINTWDDIEVVFRSGYRVKVAIEP